MSWWWGRGQAPAFPGPLPRRSCPSLALRLCAHLDFFAQLSARAVSVLTAHGARRLGVGLVITRQAGAGLGDGGNKFLFLRRERAWGRRGGGEVEGRAGAPHVRRATGVATTRKPLIMSAPARPPDDHFPAFPSPTIRGYHATLRRRGQTAAGGRRHGGPRVAAGGQAWHSPAGRMRRATFDDQ